MVSFLPIELPPFRQMNFHLHVPLKAKSSEAVEMFVCNPEVTEGAFISVSGRPLQGQRRY